MSCAPFTVETIAPYTLCGKPVPSQRWDNDLIGHGVASAASASPALRRLLDASAEADWVAEQPEVHLLPGLQAALEADYLPLRLLAYRLGTDGRLMVDLAWTSRAAVGPRAVRQAVYSLLGSVAELTTHVAERRANGDFEFTVVTGILNGDSRWVGHGHLLRLRIQTSPQA
jgi:hypothetical protein